MADETDMLVRVRAVSFLLSLLAAAAAPAQGHWLQPRPAGESRPQAPLAAPLQAAFESAFGHAGIAAGLAVSADARLLHLQPRGDFAMDQPAPIEEGSRLLVTALILRLVDGGVLDLDVGLDRWITEFDRPDKRRITLRQCLSCTAGFHEHVPAAERRAADWDEVAAALAHYPVRSGPGVEFTSSDVGFQVAAIAAMRATGLEWRSLFEQHLAGPLQLRSTEFHGLWPRGDAEHATHVPWVGRAAATTPGDFERFARMLANNGRHMGQRVLSEHSVALLFSAQVPEQATVRDPGLGGGEVSYGLGSWLQGLDGGRVRAVAIGTRGFVSWIEPDRAVAGVLLADDRLERVLPRVPELQQAVLDYLESPAMRGRDAAIRLRHDGRQRHYHLHTPPGAERALKLPLLVVLHGGGGNGEQVAATTGFSALADREGFVVVYPDGTGPMGRRLLTWNSGGIPVYASRQHVDDVGFLLAMVDDVKQRVAIDPQRIYATGMSNGGMMCHRLAREAAEVFAAIAPVSGAMNFTAAAPAGGIGVMIVHGTADRHVRYEGGRPELGTGRAGDRSDASVATAVEYYRLRNGLAVASAVEESGRVRSETWSTPVADSADQPVQPLRLVTLRGGGHAWPGAARAEHPGAEQPFDWDASAAIWAFLSEIHKP